MDKWALVSLVQASAIIGLLCWEIYWLKRMYKAVTSLVDILKPAASVLEKMKSISLPAWLGGK